MSKAIQEWLMVTWNAITHRILQRRRCISNFLCMQINKIESGIFEWKTSVSRFFFFVPLPIKRLACIAPNVNVRKASIDVQLGLAATHTGWIEFIRFLMCVNIFYLKTGFHFSISLLFAVARSSKNILVEYISRGFELAD